MLRPNRGDCWSIREPTRAEDRGLSLLYLPLTLSERNHTMTYDACYFDMLQFDARNHNPSSKLASGRTPPLEHTSSMTIVCPRPKFSHPFFLLKFLACDSFIRSTIFLFVFSFLGETTYNFFICFFISLGDTAYNYEQHAPFRHSKVWVECMGS